ncbi:GntR family transcriptional regulator, partial [Halomonas sp.]|uniref:GntR family transcriptional regulator n=1 Tax=Halomonas sp. TaxID=1486246 RepID=UPI000EEDCD99
MSFSNQEPVLGLRTPDHVAARLERLILDGVFRPGQLLPSERRLCERLKVSRASLREGLRILRSRGVIETRQGHGSTVASLLPMQDKSPLMHLFHDHPRTLFDLLEVRALLEGESAFLAATRGTDLTQQQW